MALEVIVIYSPLLSFYYEEVLVGWPMCCRRGDLDIGYHKKDPSSLHIIKWLKRIDIRLELDVLSDPYWQRDRPMEPLAVVVGLHLQILAKVVISSANENQNEYARDASASVVVRRIALEIVFDADELGYKAKTEAARFVLLCLVNRRLLAPNESCSF